MLSAVVEPAARTLLLSRRGSCFAVLLSQRLMLSAVVEPAAHS